MSVFLASICTWDFSEDPYQSQIGILKDAGCIVGFTGTLPDVADDEHQYAEFTDLMHTLYGKDTKMSAVPNFTPSRRIDHPEQIRTEQDWKHAILDNIASKKQTQPILLVCETYGEAQQFRDYLTQKGHPVKGLYRDKTDTPIIEATYGPGDIIITTRLGSRGTDWHVDKSCAGLHVICGFKPDDIRQLGQIKGRAARSGDPGSFQLIAKEKPETARTNLRAHVKSACYDDLFSGVYRSLLQGIQKLPLSPEDKKNPQTKPDSVFFDGRRKKSHYRRRRRIASEERSKSSPKKNKDPCRRLSLHSS